MWAVSLNVLLCVCVCVRARARVCMRDYPAVITQTNVMKYTLAVIVSYQLKYA